MGSMSSAIGGIFIVLVWGVPLLLVIYLFRTLSTIVEGLRSINAASQRIAVAVEKLADREA
jgi:hypothetical protein